MSRLFLFPVKYPYVVTSECFLGEEFPCLSKVFSDIYILPLKREGELVPVSGNCKVMKPLFRNKLKFFYKAIFNRKATPILIEEFFANKVYTSLKKIKVWIVGYATINNILNSQEIKEIGKILEKNDVCYFYWGKWSNCLAYFWKGKAKFVSRFHGFGDLWEESYDGYFPLRNKVISSLDRCISISKYGCEYLAKKYPGCKINFSPLGTWDNGIAIKSKDNVLRIVSCSSLWPLKRVPLIFESLNLLTDLDVEWTHIGGDGEELNELKNFIKKKTNSRLKINLEGRLFHKQVIEFYQKNPVDLFINVSRIEGVPVSIMEALSFNIPVIATNVGGTKDLINSETGVLLSSDPDTQEIIKAIQFILVNQAKFKPRQFWRKNYNASINYECFAQSLLTF